MPIRRSKQIPPTTVLILVALAVLALNCFSLLPSMHCEYLSADLTQTIYQAKQIENGLIPHLDIFCHHLLGYSYIFVALDKLFGVSPTAIKIYAYFFHLLFVIIICFVTGKLLFPSSNATAVAGLLAASIGWLDTWRAGATFNPQNYILPILALLFLTALKDGESAKKLGTNLSAFAFGLGCLIDQRLVLFAPMLFWDTISCQPINHRAILSRAVAAAFPIFAFLGYLHSEGALGEAISQTLLYPLKFRSANMSQGSAVVALHMYAMRSAPILILLAIIGLTLTWVTPLYRRVATASSVYLTCAVIFVAVGGRAYSHYLLIYSPLIVVLLSTLSTHTFQRQIFQRFMRGGILAVLLGSAVLSPLIRFGQILQKRSEITPSSSIDIAAAYVLTHTQSTDSILIWGGYVPKLYLKSQRFSPFRDVSLVTLIGTNYASTSPVDQGIVSDMVQEFRLRMSQNPPKLILYYQMKNACYQNGCADCGGSTPNADFKTLPHLEYFKDTIQKNYQLVRTLDSTQDNIEIYELIKP